MFLKRAKHGLLQTRLSALKDFLAQQMFFQMFLVQIVMNTEITDKLSLVVGIFVIIIYNQINNARCFHNTNINFSRTKQFLISNATSFNKKERINSIT